MLAKSGTSWVSQAEVVGTDSHPGDLFGFSLSLSSSTLLIGAPVHAIGSNTAQGAAYVFAKSGSTWTESTELTAQDGGTQDQLGWAVSDSGTTALVGADQHNVGDNTDQGAAYVFAS